MGSYDASCAITALPITPGNKSILVYFYEKDTSFSTIAKFLAEPFEGVYDDYGRFKVENNPLYSKLKPDFENETGLIPLKAQERDHTLLCASNLSFYAVNLFNFEENILHFGHGLMDLHVKKAIEAVQQEVACILPGFNGSAHEFEDLLKKKTKTPQEELVVEKFEKCLGSSKLTYELRANFVHEFIRSKDESTLEEVTNLEVFKSFLKDDEIDLEQYLGYCLKNLDIKEKVSIEAAKKVFFEKMCIRVMLAAMHPGAYEEMVAVSKKQLGAKKVALFKEKLKENMAEFLQEQKKLTEDFDSLKKSKYLQRLLRSMSRQSKALNSYPDIKEYFLGAMPEQISENYEDLCFFEINFYHGFKFSSMADYRQYQGIAHIEAQAKSVLKTLKVLKKDLFRQGNWETYQYDK